MCGQGTFRFFSRNMKAVHLYLSPSFFMSDCVPCYCLWAFYWPTFLHGWVISPSVALAWNWQCLRFFLHLNVDGNQLGFKKKYLCMCGCSPNVEKIFETGWWEHSEPSQQFPTKVRLSNGQRDCKEPTSYISDSTGLS